MQLENGRGGSSALPNWVGLRQTVRSSNQSNQGSRFLFAPTLMPTASFLRETSGGVLLAVKLQPRASKNEIGTPLGDDPNAEHPQLVKLVASHVRDGVYTQLVLSSAGGRRTTRYILKHLNPGPTGYIWG